ncbi:MAG: SPFH domain-containing protein [Syntrophobacteraceae bacterium]
MGTNNLVFLEVVEWFDESGREIVHRIPEVGSGEIKFGAQLIVRESQAAVLFYGGRAYDVFGPGRHTLKTGNIPILTKVLSAPWAFTSPLRAEVYMVNMKEFPNLKWGTRDPVAFKDSQLGLVRLRAFGVLNLRVTQPVLLINSLVGTQGIYTTDAIEEYLSRVVASRFNDYMGESLDSLLSLPGRYDEMSDDLKKRLQKDFGHFGIALSQFYINSITPPPEVQQAIDDQSRLAVFSDLDRLVKMKAAMALEKASEAPSEAGAGLGMGIAMMMPGLFSEALKKESGSGTGQAPCPGCQKLTPVDARFCPYCGKHLVIFDKCSKCNADIPPNAKFCPKCGSAAGEKKQAVKCPHCTAENLSDSVYCNKCGEKL